MTIKKFNHYCFVMGKEEQEMINICVSHLNPIHLKDRNDYEEYKEHYDKYTPFMQPHIIKEKISNSKHFDQLLLIKPEIKWLIKGLEEMADSAMKTYVEENKESHLRFARTQLDILDEFYSVLDLNEFYYTMDDKNKPNELFERFEKLTDEN